MVATVRWYPAGLSHFNIIILALLWQGFSYAKRGEVMPNKKLTEKQKRFCEEYLIDLNATQAAIRAGYSSKTASRIAIELLNKTHVSKYLTELMRKRSESTKITSEQVVKELEKIAFSDAEITGKEKMKALELLGKHLGMFQNQTSDENKVLEKLDEVLGGIKSEF